MNLKNFKQTQFFRLIACWILCNFLIASFMPPQGAWAQTVLNLPIPGTMLTTTPAYTPIMVKGLQIHPENPLLFDFIVDTGKSGLKVDSSNFKTESQKLIKYFLASLTIKEENLWVNLSPYEKNRIMPKDLSQTELGRDMLAQDYILKQLTASLIYPEKELGKKFWDAVYLKIYENRREKIEDRPTPKNKSTTTIASNLSSPVYHLLSDNLDLPTNILSKVWIVADKAKVLEKNNTAYIVGAHLKVLLDTDYLAKQMAPASKSTAQEQIEPQIMRQIIIPEIEREVNEGAHFAQLRQMFHSMILAAWYKQTIKNSLLNQVYSNKSKTNGVQVDDLAIKEKIYQQYLDAYKKGVFNYIKEDYDSANQQITSRKYFSGGEDFAMLKNVERETKLVKGDQNPDVPIGDTALVSFDIQKATNPDRALLNTSELTMSKFSTTEEPGIKIIDHIIFHWEGKEVLLLLNAAQKITKGYSLIYDVFIDQKATKTLTVHLHPVNDKMIVKSFDYIFEENKDFENVLHHWLNSQIHLPWDGSFFSKSTTEPTTAPTPELTIYPKTILPKATHHFTLQHEASAIFEEQGTEHPLKLTIERADERYQKHVYFVKKENGHGEQSYTLPHEPDVADSIPAIFWRYIGDSDETEIVFNNKSTNPFIMTLTNPIDQAMMDSSNDYLTANLPFSIAESIVSTVLKQKNFTWQTKDKLKNELLNYIIQHVNSDKLITFVENVLTNALTQYVSIPEINPQNPAETEHWRINNERKRQIFEFLQGINSRIVKIGRLSDKKIAVSLWITPIIAKQTQFEPYFAENILWSQVASGVAEQTIRNLQDSFVKLKLFDIKNDKLTLSTISKNEHDENIRILNFDSPENSAKLEIRYKDPEMNGKGERSLSYKFIVKGQPRAIKFIKIFSNKEEARQIFDYQYLPNRPTDKTLKLLTTDILFHGKMIDAAMAAKAEIKQINGGIDLNSKNMSIDITNPLTISGSKPLIKFDPGMIAEFEAGDFSGVTFKIISIIPIQNTL
ncbi:MAG: hypothetical protein HQL26_05395 [Candidatus Omnitrophica bacterium]|nr:hypothetical protein [Candidatus Omnitrophota bacterium]